MNPDFYIYSAFGADENLVPKTCSRCGIQPTYDEALHKLTWWMDIDPYFNTGILLGGYYGDDFVIERSDKCPAIWFRKMPNKDGIARVGTPFWVDQSPHAETIRIIIGPFEPTNEVE